MTTEALAPRFVGRRVQRKEDPRFLRGHGRYIDDIVLARMLHAWFTRSSEAHARILSVDPGPALAEDGVVAALTGADVVDLLEPIHANSTMGGWQASGYPPVASDRVRFVGEIVAVAVAEDRYLAEDAAELIDVAYETLPPLVSVEQALRADAEPLHEGWTDNRYLTRKVETDGFEDAMAAAPRRKKLRYRVARHTGMPLETRGCIADWDRASETLTLRTSTQIPHLVRTALAESLRMPEHRVRVISPDVGGGFGIKANIFPEEIICAFLSRKTGRPVKWIEDRREHMMASVHAREHDHEVEVGYDEDGTIHALRGTIHVDCGAYSVFPWTASMEAGMAMGVLPGPYRIRNYSGTAVSVATNKCPLGAYRGVARPAAAFTTERVTDAVAEDVGLDRAEIRRRNLVRSDEFPYLSVTGLSYDSGSYIESLDLALEKADYDGFRTQQEDARRQGRYLGIGVVTYTEQTAHTHAEFSKRGMPITFGSETATMRMDPSGAITLHTSIHSHGQGLETTLAQVAADSLGIDIDDVRVSFGDSSEVVYGNGTFGSRSAVLCGGATQQAGEVLRARIQHLTAALLEAAVDDVEVADGRAFVRGEPESGYTFAEIARAVYLTPHVFPAESEVPMLESTRSYDAAPGTGAFANCAMVAVVEVDPATGFVTIERLLVVEDCGRVINPLVVEGQVHGGVAQGIGSALFEELIYDDQGQLVTTSLLDYLMPGSTDIPSVEVHHLETPSPFTVNGMKGMGEGGAIGPLPLLASAVEDAIRPLTDAHVDRLPLTPERVRGWITQGRSAPAEPSQTTT